MKEVSASRNTNYLTKKMHTKPLFLKDIKRTYPQAQKYFEIQKKIPI